MYLILRPKAKLADSVLCFQEAGLSALGCGLIDTATLPDAFTLLPSLYAFTPDLVVVTSTVAADLYIDTIAHIQGVDRLQTEQNKQASNLPFIAVGTSTAKKLSSQHERVIQARPSNSEGILACVSHLKLKHANVAILKGKGGRNLISNTLSASGFAVKEFDLYERLLLKAPYYTGHFEAAAIQCIIATSTEIIDAAYNYFEPEWLNKCQWIVVSKRVKQHLSALGANNIFTSNGATDSHLIAAANQVKGS
ncbi:MAG: uroporphyrinogen-III synthase [Bermanella sp.]|jgi:uroporphyrinogen-III synthase|uniref:uroporphyrinogen-III synthase n=1 Tax=Glaciecola sp. 33A TaxID=2057807 RepID=UPI000C32C7B8|nr:uroporphyrinogen-III synthase [Glaciecola sp. 33A]PKI02719.1 uroporphyrinogen-III synthase [Glaciecola sp. 33A]